MLVGRYRLEQVLGRGAYGSVHAASDERTGRTVAVKLLAGLSDSQLALVRREVAMLRILRLPGVVQLLDEDSEQSVPFIVMELVEGREFAEAAPRTWEELEPSALALLEAVDRIHWAGILHRDLKPENVLVDAHGRLTILDLGTAEEASPGDAETPEPAVEGTPVYLSPERLRGRPATVASDLYAVGAMLYEALSGALPHACDSMHQFLARRLSAPPEPLRDVAPGVPENVARTVDALLEVEPRRRPQSARAAFVRMRGRAGRPLPWLGGDGVVEQLLAAVRERRSVDVHGPTGCGRSRTLRRFEKRLEESGHAARRLREASAPWESAREIVGDPTAFQARSAQEVENEVDRRVVQALRSGTIIIADDPEGLDPWTRRRLAGWRSAGCVVRARGPAARPEASMLLVQPLAPADLAPLFEGSDRLFHVPEDAAALLHRRTHGLPARIVAELDAWVRAGFARRERDRFVVSREALGRLQTGLHLGTPAESATRSDVPAGSEELVACVAVAGEPVHEDLLTEVVGWPRWRVEAQVEELVARGLLGRDDGGRITGALPAHALVDWPEERIAECHGRWADALPSGAPGRLRQLIGAGRSSEVAAEALRIAEQLRDAGRMDGAEAALTEGLLADRSAGSELETSLLGALVDLALARGTARALDNALYRVGRARVRTPEIEQLEAVARAALFAVRGEADRALDALSSVPDAAPEETRHRVATVTVVAARYLPPERETEIVTGVLDAARHRTSMAWRSSVETWTGWLRYRQGRFEEAARHHESAAAIATSRLARLSSLLNAASAFMEAHELEAAERAAAEALGIAEGVRHPLHEARAEWLLRALAYRRGRALEPDVTLAHACPDLGAPHVEALILLGEAAIARRVGRESDARDWAAAAARRWEALGGTEACDLARALALACGGSSSRDEARAMVDRARNATVPAVAMQTLALLCESMPTLRAQCVEVAQTLDRAIERRHRSRTREVLSIEEAMAALERPEGRRA